MNLPTIKKGSIDLIYIEVPLKNRREQGDKPRDYISFLMDRVELAYPLLSDNGSFFLQADYREVHYIKIEMDKLFGRSNFMNEIILAYEGRARSRSRWPTKHHYILWYTKDNKNYSYNYEEIDRIPYMAPILVGDEKAKRGKTPTDVWWDNMPILTSNSKEKNNGNKNSIQRPFNILERIILAHSNVGDTVLVLSGGNEMTGMAAKKHGRQVISANRNKKIINPINQRHNNV